MAETEPPEPVVAEPEGKEPVRAKRREPRAPDPSPAGGRGLACVWCRASSAKQHL